MKTLKLIGAIGLLFAVASCGGNKQNDNDSTADDAQAVQEQPLASGVYDATYFDIKGSDARKGQFDGRVLYSLSPDQSVILVYENGNRTKIKHLIMLSAPFKKGDSTYTSTDAKGNPVVLSNDSANFRINYIANSDTVTITQSQTPRNTYTALEALEKIHEEAAKK